jgi:hypothetical protein
MADPDPARDLQDRQALGRAENNLRPLQMLERATAIRDNGDQTFAILVGRKDADGLRHAGRLARPPAIVNPLNVSAI